MAGHRRISDTLFLLTHKAQLSIALSAGQVNRF